MKTLHKPPYLKRGDKICIISTARKVSAFELEPAIQVLESWDLKIVKGKNLHEEFNQFAGNDEQRLSDLQNALDDPEIKAIFCARGGYGTPRIIDQVYWNKFISNPKWIIGFSDVTVLLNKVQNLGMCSIHAPMLLFFTKEEYQISISLLREYLFGRLSFLNNDPHFLNRTGESTGVLIGGNLSLIVNSIGTGSEFAAAGKILFLEDIDEYLYHIDRMLLQLKRSGVLSQISGLVVGHFTDMKDNAIPFGENAYEIIARNVQEYSYPVAFGFQSGHDVQNFPLPIGNKVKLLVLNEAVKVEFS
ncbi:MAG: LD-carboxypeptidase [Opitutaceae bacterium]|nr:LD-carboxypeptidase [Cytophagales bacterium]